MTTTVTTTVIMIPSHKLPEEGEGVTGGSRLAVTPGTRVFPLAWVPDSWSTHSRSFQGVQGLASTLPAGHLGSDTGRTSRGSAR